MEVSEWRMRKIMLAGGHVSWGGGLGVFVCVQRRKVLRKCQRALPGTFMNALWALCFLSRA